jgi:hypothetical protein
MEAQAAESKLDYDQTKESNANIQPTAQTPDYLPINPLSPYVPGADAAPCQRRAQ